MVDIKRIGGQNEEQEIDPMGDRFKLIEVYVQEPSSNPNDGAKVGARPYEFDGYTPTKYSTSCPHCGQGIWFEPNDMQCAVDCLFIACPECGAGETKLPPIIDPFINPVGEKVAESVIDTDLVSAHNTIPPAAGSVEIRMSEEALAEIDEKYVTTEDIRRYLMKNRASSTLKN